jgi:ribonuclease Z
MKIVFLGTGAAIPDPDRNQSAIHITVRDRSYLFDCGHNATRQMVRAHLDPTIVNFIFLSHLHYDHISDFAYFMISTWMCGRERAPVVVGPEGTQNFVDSLLEHGAYAKDIEARAQYPNRRKNIEVLRADVRQCDPGVVFEDDYVKVSACYVEHIPREISPCFGFRMDTVDGQSIAFSGDTAPCDRFIQLARGVDLLIHECTFPEKAIEFRKKAGIGTWAHTSPIELGKLAEETGAKSLVATHIGHYDTTNPVVKRFMAVHMPAEIIGPELLDEAVTDIRTNYGGELRLAHDLMRVDL